VEAADGAPEATMPGWREEARRRVALREGVPISAAILDRLSVLDEMVGRSIVNG
jgi:LDH2 family malate/lactate/ureidoglycolate dehydrogenase